VHVSVACLPSGTNSNCARSLDFFSHCRAYKINAFCLTMQKVWLGGRVVSVLDSGAEGPGVQIAVATLSGNSLRQTVHIHYASVH